MGKPDSTSAIIGDVGPGVADTGILASRAAPTSLNPGSEINGVPASETNATASPFRNISKRLFLTATALWSWYAIIRVEIP